MRKRNLILSLFAHSDEQAMWRVQSQDDHQAFAQLVERWEQPILQLCARMTGDAHRGEDLKQEAFARVFSRRKDFRPEAKVSTWLWRTGPKGETAALITGIPNSGEMGANGADNANRKLGARDRTNDPLKEDSRITPPLDKTGAGSESSASARATVMAIRVKKSAADSLAAKEFSEDVFERQAEVTTYLGRAFSTLTWTTGYQAK